MNNKDKTQKLQALDNQEESMIGGGRVDTWVNSDGSTTNLVTDDKSGKPLYLGDDMKHAGDIAMLSGNMNDWSFHIDNEKKTETNL